MTRNLSKTFPWDYSLWFVGLRDDLTSMGEMTDINATAVGSNRRTASRHDDDFTTVLLVVAY